MNYNLTKDQQELVDFLLKKLDVETDQLMADASPSDSALYIIAIQTYKDRLAGKFLERFGIAYDQYLKVALTGPRPMTERDNMDAWGDGEDFDEFQADQRRPKKIK